MLEKLKEIICNCVPVEPEDITPDAKLLGDLGLSSLDLVMVSVEIEKEFGITIPDKDFTSIKTVGGLVEYLEKNSKN